VSEGRHKPYVHGLCARSSHCHDPSLAVDGDGKRSWVSDRPDSTAWSALNIGIPAGRAVTSNAGIRRIGFTPPPAGRAGEGATGR
jgi:hypothetical protein